MNDRFKFRVWDKVSKRYFFIELKFGDNGYHPLFIEKPIFEQCTGLKDKNSKLIYEGDVVEIIDRENSNTLDRIYPMLFNEKVAKFGYKHPDGHFFYHSNNDDYSYEVVGNIHENPEMIDENHRD